MGSMLQTVLRNLVSRPATRRYPFERREPFERARGQIEFNVEKCLLCGLCQRRCPAAAITVNRPERTLSFEPFRCIICEACVEACPKKCITAVAEYRAPEYAKEAWEYRVPVAVPSRGDEKVAEAGEKEEKAS